MAVEQSMGKKRIDFIDALRGYVILMMLQGHTLNLTLADEVRERGGWLYEVWFYMTGVTAPAFFFTSGMIFTYLLVKDDDEKRVQRRLVKGLRRGWWLVVLGFVLQLNLRALWEMAFAGREYEWWGFLGRSGVLQTIGLSVMILVGLFSFCRLLGWRFHWVAGVLGVLAFVLGPLSHLQPAGLGWSRVWTVFVVREQAYFPILQWVGFSFFGAVFGVLTQRFPWYKSGRFLAGLVLGGLLLTHVGNFVAYQVAVVLADFFGYEAELWWGANAGAFYRLGEVLVLVAIMAWLVEIVRGGLRPQWLLRCGQETLSIFFLHVLVLYGGLFGYGFSRDPFKESLSHCLEPWPAVFLAGCVVVAFAVLAQFLPALRKRWPWLEWLR